MRGYRKDKNPFVQAAKGAGRFMHEMAEAAAEAERERQARETELAAIELEHRSTVEDALKEYEKNVGRPYQLDSRFTTAKVDQPIAGFNTGLPWDYDNKGHLFTCRDNCMTDHCITCGEETYGRVHCLKHRP
jgi:hypothetical protein